MAEGSKKAIVAAFLANLGIALAKLVGFAITGAASMLAEAVHSLADSGNQGLLLLGSKRARQPPDDRHPFGHSAERYFWAFVVALVLFSLGSLFTIYEGIHKVLDAHPIDSPLVATGILLIAIVLEGLSLRTAVREATPARRAGERWWRFIRRTKNAELPVVLLEDTGALVGLLVALTGIVLAEVTDEPRWDALGSIGIGLVLGLIAVVLAVEMKSLLIGEAADDEVVASLRRAITGGPEVRGLIHLRTLQLGPDDILVAAKVDLEGETREEVAAAIDRTEARMRVAAPTARLIFLEPDVTRRRGASPPV